MHILMGFFCLYHTLQDLIFLLKICITVIGVNQPKGTDGYLQLPPVVLVWFLFYSPSTHF